ncbi:FadR family transcriptional regulator [Paenibacillus nanensis]|uniref:FadR family transcriptional regulator n=1 Tax=Paenibacillus nanensis TaxID=393251 RepID=A0A3A1V5S1_9BACL|nr:FadR/GntR family transcriptional regulator [Paenibacillus nanensis]RIX53983.1 FadR family transcriptional regulator [Paenibacillus nanensis]
MRNMKIETEKGHEIVGRLILENITRGEWEPGAKLPSVVELSARFGVGRSTIREALSALKATGWLDIRHGGGTFVKKVLPSETAQGGASPFQEADSILELLEVRKILETGTSALAAERRTEEDLAKLSAILDRMNISLQSNDTAGGEQADVEFHAAIAEASRNSLLTQLMGSLAQRLGETIGKTRELWFYQQKSTSERLLDEHRSIYNAIAEGDAALASQLIRDHLNKVESTLRHLTEQ